ncbi:MAG: hypothetical protein GY856_21045, partial [bacterium]|nr:hypothetical protein [bacterium]
MVEIRYGFLRPGEVVEPRRGYVYLDLGNRKEPGVVDHHFAEYQGEAFECTTSLLQAEPQLVTGWIRAQDLDQPIHVCVHESPDFDCIAASYLARALLAAKAAGRALPEGWSDWAPLLARTARRIDQGRTRIVPPAGDATASITAYLAVLGLGELVENRPRPPRDNWSWMLDQGHRILDRAIELALPEGLADLDQLDLRNRLPAGLPVDSWVDRRLRAFRNDAGRLGLLPGTAPAKAVDGIETIELLDRAELTTTHRARIAFISDPDSGGGFFKNLIRGGYSDEIQATCVFTTCHEDPLTGAPAWMQPIISVDPESVYSLRGLGQLLEIREKEMRAAQGLRRVGPPRPGYDNPDPWFDGRSFDYTIVDAPRWGTLLTPDKVRQEVLDWQRWHQHCREDIVRRTPQLLRAPLLAPEERHRLLGDLITAVIHLNRGPEDKASQPPLLAKTALSELVGVLREEDSEVLDEVPDLLRMHAFVIAVLATPRPALRAWVLRRITANGSWRELAACLRTIDRPDLLLPVHLAVAGELTAGERESLLRALRGLRLTSDHARLLDALTTFDRETPDALVELGRKLCEQAARVAGLEKSLLHLARELSSRTTAPAGLVEEVEAWAEQAELAAKAPAGDELEALWSGCLRDLALGTDDGTAG